MRKSKVMGRAYVYPLRKFYATVMKRAYVYADCYACSLSHTLYLVKSLRAAVKAVTGVAPSNDEIRIYEIDNDTHKGQMMVECACPSKPDGFEETKHLPDTF